MPAGEIIFNKFEILQWLKKDEYAAVYHANHIYLGKPIILKVLDTHALPDEVTIQRFKREAKILARLDHPNIIKVLDFGVHEQFFYISFEYFESQSLRSLLKARSLSVEEKREILLQILEGLRYAHANEVIHRDIKCENILVDDSLQAKIADFGLALTSAESRTTNPQFLVGTPAYMSPEQILGQSITAQSDLFSLGIVAYEMYVGTHPFIGKDVNQSLNNIVSFDEDRLFNTLPQLPDDIRSIITGSLRKNPRDRFRTVGEMLEKLKVSSAPERLLKTQTKKQHAYLALGIVAVLVALLALFVTIYRPGRTEISVQPLPAPAAEEMSQRSAVDSILQVSSNQRKVAIPRDPASRVAKSSKTSTPSAERQHPVIAPMGETMGELSIECLPWAYVVLDSARIDTTPLRQNIHLAAGTYDLQLIHPGYPLYRQPVQIASSQVTKVKVNLDTLFGFLQVEAFPWGEVLINGTSYGLTPLQNPIKLIPGEYTVEVKNAQFGSVEKIVVISRRDTAQVRHRFERF